MDQEFRIPTKSQERVQNRDIIHDCISNFAGHNCGQELKYSCSCKVGLNPSVRKNLNVTKSGTETKKKPYSVVLDRRDDGINETMSNFP